ncbi:unnamed protein product [Fusarium graminearum]|uniref:Uncharacterized protein n=1 Tax=Gibberella zeae TaxID=5518 RepID=A0A4E9E7F7_GIBZA|nr:unnamed protein product [Fusarium graminearum]CAF3616463.1 unnamed protein product [Fusarium graminearum]CAG1980792.1 unnamed protein product [Fusarium graminearum]CAG2012823.1 unnamed protein product [Fusarium graminearum]
MDIILQMHNFMPLKLSINSSPVTLRWISKWFVRLSRAGNRLWSKLKVGNRAIQQSRCIVPRYSVYVRAKRSEILSNPVNVP